MKNPLLSKTLWFNGINAFVGLVSALTPDLLPWHVTPEQWKWQAFILFVGNGILRFLTDKPVVMNAPLKEDK